MYLEYETDRMILKILKPSCAEQVLDFYNRDKELFEKYEPDRVDNFYTREYQQTMLKVEYNLLLKKEVIRFYCFRKEDPNQIIGTVCFHDINFFYYKSAELGYKFSSQFHHMGYAHEALEKALEIMFSDLGLHRIEAWVLPENKPSIHLLEGLHFTCEGLCKSNLLLHGKWEDHYQFSLISSLDTQ